MNATSTPMDASRVEHFLEELRWAHGFLDVPQWPDPMGDAAFHGLAGEFVRTVEPHTEADPVALLVQFLCEYGNVIGRNCYVQVESDRHYTNLFVVLVGQTAKARKGTSERNVRTIIKAVSEDWGCRVMSGLASGEGLIWQVRDPIERTEPVKEKGRVNGYQNIIVDQGVSDKRLMIVEPELARVFRVLEREGSTLSALIREAWDSGDLRTLTKNSPARATNAHVSIIGHITREELLRAMTEAEAANGFGNRILWFGVKRSKLLPRGGRWDSINWAPFLRKLAVAVDFGSRPRRMDLDAEAWEYWDAVYPDLADGKPGLLGAMTARAEAQTLRLAMIYALLDLDELIRVPHLEAALAVWRYSYQTCQWLWGQRLGDPVADAIMAALKRAGEKGLTRTQIYSDLFRRNVPRDRIEAALSALAGAGLARAEKRSGGGRPIEVWVCLSADATH
jgi:hypothetical protein